MREELSEPRHWRSRTRSDSWFDQRQSVSRSAGSIPALPADAVDAAFADDSISVEPVRGSRRDLATPKLPAEEPRPQVAEARGQGELLQSLSAQLAMLDAQRAQLQTLLAQAQNNRD